MKPKIVYLPYDARPPSLQHVKRLAEMGGLNLATPPRRLFGDLRRPANSAALGQWLEGAAKGADCAIVSLDALAYGGLVQSRVLETSQKKALRRLQVFRSIRKRRPNLKIYGFNIAMRDAVTALDRASYEKWKAMQGPKPCWPEEFLRCRERNFAIHCEALSWLEDGTFDLLAIAKEDVSPGSPFRGELARLRRLIREKNLSKWAFVQPGADEIGQLLLARARLDLAGARFGVFADAADPAVFQLRPLYEHEPIANTLRRKLQLAGAYLKSGPQKADGVLLLHGFRRPQKDLFLLQLQRRKAPGQPLAERLVAKAVKYIESGANAAVADLAFANGGDAAFAGRLLKDGLFFKLAAYSAWNTCGNALGTAIAGLICAADLAGEPTEGREAGGRRRARRLFLAERALDDVYYQSEARGELLARMKDPWVVADLAKEERRLRSALETRFRRRIAPAIKRAGASPDFGEETIIKKAAFPWKRPFEAEIELKDAAIRRVDGKS